MTLDQWIEWLAFYRLRPFGSKRDDIRAANQTFWTVTGFHQPPPDNSPRKYMPDFKDDPPLNEAAKRLKFIKERFLSG